MNEQTVVDAGGIAASPAKEQLEKLISRPGKPPTPMTPEWVRDLVSYHQPDTQGIECISNIREAAEAFINAILKYCPASADRTDAIRSARNAMMTANASIVLAGRG